MQKKPKTKNLKMVSLPKVNVVISSLLGKCAPILFLEMPADDVMFECL